MRLLVLASADVVHARRWCDWFVGRGHEVCLATLEPSEQPAGYDRGLISFPLPGALRYPLARQSLSSLIRDFRPELVNAHYLPGYGFLAALTGGARPLAISTWGSDILINPGQSRLHRARARFTLKRCGLVTSDSPVLTEALAGLGVERGRIVEQPMGIDPSEFYPAERPPVNETPLVVSTRHHEPVYDLGTLLDALGRLKHDGTAFRAVVAGEGGQSTNLHHQRLALELEREVEFTGRLRRLELAAELRTAEVYVSTSLSDSTSVSLLEAMASGAFPVVSDIPGNRDWISHERNGLLFPPGDAIALASCLTRALADSALRLFARRINAGIIRERALWDDNMRRIEQAFVELASQRR